MKPGETVYEFTLTNPRIPSVIRGFAGSVAIDSDRIFIDDRRVPVPRIADGKVGFIAHPIGDIRLSGAKGTGWGVRANLVPAPFWWADAL